MKISLTKIQFLPLRFALPQESTFKQRQQMPGQDDHSHDNSSQCDFVPVSVEQGTYYEGNTIPEAPEELNMMPQARPRRTIHDLFTILMMG
jgi:hypothetical protein